MTLNSINPSYNNFTNYNLHQGNAEKPNTAAETTGNDARKYTNTSEYTRYLQQNFSGFGKPSNVDGVNTTVAVSPELMKQCINDPEKAAYLEENLNTIYNDHQPFNVPGSDEKVISADWKIESDGSISVATWSQTGSSENTAKEIAEEKAKEKKEEEEKLEKLLKERSDERKAEFENYIQKSTESNTSSPQTEIDVKASNTKNISTYQNNKPDSENSEVNFYG